MERPAITLRARCTRPGCRVTDTVTVTARDYARYVGGHLVQDVWPNLNDDEREVIIAQRTGFYLCQKEWNKMEGDE